MADERKFKFISPGVFVNEIDRSQVPAFPESIGPVIIGRAQKGPSMVPVKVRSLAEFVSIFGDPEPGNQQLADIWREGSKNAPLYGSYAARAFLTVGSTPVTFIRLAGINNSNSATGERARAGWTLNATTTTGSSANSVAGAYGLFVLGSNTGVGEVAPTPDVTSVPVVRTTAQSLTGTLGAIFYTSGAALLPKNLTTNPTNLNSLKIGMNTIISGNVNKEVILQLSTSAGNAGTIVASFDRNSPNFIRNAFNTNPQLIDSIRIDATSVEDSTAIKSYWLGETYERTVKEEILDKFPQVHYVMAPLVFNSNSKADHRSSYREAQTPWIIKQDTRNVVSPYAPALMDKLFKFVSLNGQGDYCSSNIKISVENLRYSVNKNDDFSTFDVVLRDAKDSDTKPIVFERFSNVNLNPNSVDYIANRIGDQYLEFDTVTQEIRTFGDRPNRSRYVRVVMSSYVANSVKPQDLPFGYHGLVKPKSAQIFTDNTSVTGTFLSNSGMLGVRTLLFASGTHASDSTSSIFFPSVPLRTSASLYGTNHLTAYFGVDTNRDSGVSIYNNGYIDYTRFAGENIIPASEWNDNFGLGAAPAGTEYEYGFSLDEITVVTGSGYTFSSSPKRNILDASWESGSRARDNDAGSPTTVGSRAFNSRSGGANLPTSASFKNILDAGINRFSIPMFGGFDGFNAFEREPMRNSYIQASDTVETNYVKATYERAINTIANPDFVEYNLVSIPGLTNTSLTKTLMDTCEARGDAMAVIDLVGGYVPPHEEYKSTETDRRGSLISVFNNLDSRDLNNSYAATYYPWVTIRDDRTNTFVKVPPSVVALGVLANTERVSDVWFAPAGFNRGGISNGAAGYPVVSVDQKLTSGDRDDLYKRSVNPIASFPSEGIVIFGQKTLQALPETALSRINVRRLMIYLKKGISRIASTVLFEQNVQATWNDFKTRADNFLSGVKVRFGLDDYRVVLDESTTTPDLVDRNIMYAQVYVKPTRSIEYIALDFIITRSGASFDD